MHRYALLRAHIDLSRFIDHSLRCFGIRPSQRANAKLHSTEVAHDRDDRITEIGFLHGKEDRLSGRAGWFAIVGHSRLKTVLSDAVGIAMVDGVPIGGTQSIENLLCLLFRTAGGEKRPKD